MFEKTIGKAGFFKMSCTLNKCDEIEDIMSNHTDDISEVYKSEWHIDEDGDVIVHYAYRATKDGFSRYSKGLDSKRYYELVKKMELVEF